MDKCKCVLGQVYQVDFSDKLDLRQKFGKKVMVENKYYTLLGFTSTGFRWEKEGRKIVGYTLLDLSKDYEKWISLTFS